MAKRIVVFLILVMTALTIDLLRQEAFAWMDPGFKREAVSTYAREVTFKNAVPGITSAAPAAFLTAPYPPPPGQASRILFLPAISNAAGQ